MHGKEKEKQRKKENTLGSLSDFLFRTVVKCPSFVYSNREEMREEDKKKEKRKKDRGRKH
jgi:hypothetical protein